MERPRGRRIAIVVTALGICAAAVAGFLVRGQIVDQWYLRKLEAGTPEERVAAIEKLGDVGSETALIRLHERFIHNSAPGRMILAGNPGGTGLYHSMVLAQVSPDRAPSGTPGELNRENDSLLESIGRIGQRLGK